MLPSTIKEDNLLLLVIVSEVNLLLLAYTVSMLLRLFKALKSEILQSQQSR